MNGFHLGHLETHLCVLQDLEQERTPRLPLTLRVDLQASSEELHAALAHDDSMVVECHEELVEHKTDVRVDS